MPIKQVIATITGFSRRGGCVVRLHKIYAGKWALFHRLVNLLAYDIDLKNKHLSNFSLSKEIL